MLCIGRTLVSQDVHLPVCPSDCLSVTRWYCVETVKHIVTLFHYRLARSYCFFRAMVMLRRRLPNGSVECKGKKQELTYCKQIARQLGTQYVEGIYRPKYYSLTLKSRLRVTLSYWKRNHWIDHTQDIQRQRMAWPWILGLGLFKVIENAAVR